MVCTVDAPHKGCFRFSKTVDENCHGYVPIISLWLSYKIRYSGGGGQKAISRPMIPIPRLTLLREYPQNSIFLLYRTVKHV